MDLPSSRLLPPEEEDNTYALRALLPHANVRTRALLSALNSRLRARSRLLSWQDFIKDFFVVDYNPAIPWEQQYVLLERWVRNKRADALPFAALHPRLREPAFWFAVSQPSTPFPAPPWLLLSFTMETHLHYFLFDMNPDNEDDLRFLLFLLQHLDELGLEPGPILLERLLRTVLSRSSGPSPLVVRTLLESFRLPPDRELRARLLFVVAKIFANAHKERRLLAPSEREVLRLLIYAGADPAIGWRDVGMVGSSFTVYDAKAYQLLGLFDFPRYLFHYESLSEDSDL